MLRQEQEKSRIIGSGRQSVAAIPGRSARSRYATGIVKWMLVAWVAQEPKCTIAALLRIEAVLRRMFR